MKQEEKNEILIKFGEWFKNSLILNHKNNTEKLSDIKEFYINPFLLYYLANYLEGNSEPKSLAKALVYPRVLGTSITTSFGNGMQTFITNVLGAYGSMVSGIDIEFIDNLDGRKKYCQLKSGPNAINNDDVETVKMHFNAAIYTARQNRRTIGVNDLVFCLIYGEPEEKNSFIKKLERSHIVYIGKEFWHRFTGDENFYKELIKVVNNIARDVNMKSIVDDIIDKLSEKIETRFKDLFD